MPDARDTMSPEFAWAPYKPSPQAPWNLARAAHLWRRAGFGATWGQLQESLEVGPQRTVDRLLKPRADVDAFNRTCDGYAEKAASAVALRAWWLRRMIQTPHPLLEKLTLFWHDFFAVGAAGVDDASLMLRHVQLLRAGAVGRFDTLLAAIARDPAALLSLGAKASRKAMPDDSFARQLLRRYTVGEGTCSDKDVREAARAMTGRFVLRGKLRFIGREHDGDEKTILGKTGKFTSEDVVKIAAAHPATARNVVRRLYRWLISETDAPTEVLLAPLAASFAEDFDVGRLVETMLRSNLLFSRTALGRRIKRPVEYAIGIIRALEGTVPTVRLAADLASLGENLYHPPTPSGWQGGRHWLNHATLIGRSNLATALLAPSGPYNGKLDPAAVARKHGHTDARSGGRFLMNLLLQPSDADRRIKEFPAVAAPDGGLRKFAHAVVTQPEFQLA